MDWNKIAKDILKSELKKSKVSSEQLASYLNSIGVNESRASINSKISRGTFSASFLLQVLSSIGAETLDIPRAHFENPNIIHEPPMTYGKTKAPMLYTDLKTGTIYIDNPSSTNDAPKQKPTVVSLFSGAGGMDIGLESAGYETLVCIDNDLDCLETLRYNRPQWRLITEYKYKEDGKTYTRPVGDIRFISGAEILNISGRKKGEVTLVVGGAPCQPFSNIGKKKGQKDKENGDLFLEFVRIIQEIEPQGFIFENVAGITQKRHKEVINYMIDQFRGLNYGLSHSILNSANYGVGQRRERFFLIGLKGLNKPAFPLPTHFKDSKSWSMFTKYFDLKPTRMPKPWVTVRQVFESLPLDYKTRSDYAVMGVSDVVKERMKLIKRGENFKVLPMDMRPNCWKNGKHQGSDTFGRLRLDAPSVTIRTAAYNSAKGRYIHPVENRGLDTIEMAALQSFPPSWTFKCKNREKVTLVSGGRQIGNAVPPLLAKAIGKALLNQVKF